MNQKEFERLQTAVQWVLDEQRYREEHPRARGSKKHRMHMQSLWARGVVSKTRVKVKDQYLNAQYDFRAICTSGCCLAGNVVLAEGDKAISCLPAGAIDSNAGICVTTEGDVLDINVRARDLLGLNHDQAQQLFAAQNTPERIVQLATHYARIHGYTLEVI